MIAVGPPEPGTTLRPLVLGPAQVPVVTDVDDAVRVPELAVLSAIAHGSHPERDQVLAALMGALLTIDPDHAALYSDVVLAALPTAAQRHLEALMIDHTYEPQSDFFRRQYFQGKAEGEAAGEAAGEAKAVLAVLDARGIDVPAEARTRITACTDLDQLDAWVRRAVTAASIHDLLD